MFDPSKPPSTLAELAQRSFVTFADRPYLGEKRNGTYEFNSYGEIALRVCNLCGALLELGLVRGERVAIVGDNRIEWALTDLACQMSGLISVPIYSTLPAVQ